jgi:hypothetical protein
MQLLHILMHGISGTFVLNQLLHPYLGDCFSINPIIVPPFFIKSKIKIPSLILEKWGLVEVLHGPAFRVEDSEWLQR